MFRRGVFYIFQFLLNFLNKIIMAKKKIAVAHMQFSVVFNEELEKHGIDSNEFMTSCRIKHDNYSGVKRVTI